MRLDRCDRLAVQVRGAGPKQRVDHLGDVARGARRVGSLRFLSENRLVQKLGKDGQEAFSIACFTTP